MPSSSMEPATLGSLDWRSNQLIYAAALNMKDTYFINLAQILHTAISELLKHGT